MEFINLYSKNICMALFCVMLSLQCFCQSVTFMGIDINENFISFNQKLASKIGMGDEDPQDGHVCYSSAFAGMDDCFIRVKRTSNGMVYCIEVSKIDLRIDVINSIIDVYTNKYGTPYEITNTQARTSYNYKVGIQKIQIRVTVRKDGMIFFYIYYYPKGYINDKSNVNVQIDQSDI